MIRKITLAFCLMFFFITSGSLFAQMEETRKSKNDFVEQADKEFAKLKQSKIKVRTRFAGFLDVEGKKLVEELLVEKTAFDKKGNKIESIRYQGNGLMDSRYNYKYDSKGRLIKSETRNAGDYLVATTEYKYDKNGNEIERKMFTVRSGNFSAKFIYDKDNNVIESTNFDKKKKFTGKYVNYFENGKAKRTTIYGKDNKVLKEIYFIYDAEGKILREETRVGVNGYSIEYKLDANGNYTEIKKPDSKRVVTYDAANNILQDKMFMHDGARQYFVEFSYLENGLQNQEIRYDNNDKPAYRARYEYEFYK